MVVQKVAKTFWSCIRNRWDFVKESQFPTEIRKADCQQAEIRRCYYKVSFEKDSRGNNVEKFQAWIKTESEPVLCGVALREHEKKQQQNRQLPA